MINCRLNIKIVNTPRKKTYVKSPKSAWVEIVCMGIKNLWLFTQVLCCFIHCFEGTYFDTVPKKKCVIHPSQVHNKLPNILGKASKTQTFYHNFTYYTCTCIIVYLFNLCKLSKPQYKVTKYLVYHPSKIWQVIQVKLRCFDEVLGWMKIA